LEGTLSEKEYHKRECTPRLETKRPGDRAAENVWYYGPTEEEKEEKKEGAVCGKRSGNVTFNMDGVRHEKSLPRYRKVVGFETAINVVKNSNTGSV